MSFLLNGMLNITLTMSAVILIMLALSRLLGNKFTAGCRYLLWTIIIVRLAIPVGGVLFRAPLTIELPAEIAVQSGEPAALPAGAETALHTETPASVGNSGNAGIVSGYPVSGMPPENAETVGTPVSGSALYPLSDTVGTGSAGETEKNASADENGVNAASAIQTETVISLIFGIWASVAAALFILRIVSYLRFVVNLSRRRSLCYDAELNTFFAGLCGRFGIGQRPVLYTSTSVASPMVYGFFSPAVIIPDNYSELTSIEGIIAHELVHYKRGDLWLKLISQLALALNWFNPLVYIAVDKFTQAAELSCDETVLRDCEMSSRLDYGSTMLEIIKGCEGDRRVGTGMTTHFNPSARAVKERLRNILDMKGKSRGIALIAALLLLCIFAGTFVACGFGDKSAANTDNSGTVTDDTIVGDTTASDTIFGENTGNPAEYQSEPAQNYRVAYEAYLSAIYKVNPADEPALTETKLKEILAQTQQLYPDAVLYLREIADNGDVLVSAVAAESTVYLQYDLANEKLDKLDEIPTVSKLVFHSGELKSGGGCYTAAIGVDGSEPFESGGERLYIKYGRLYYAFSDTAYALPFDASGLDIDVIGEYYHTFTVDSCAAVAFRGGDIGGLDAYAYVFIMYYGTESWQMAALKSPDDGCSAVSISYEDGLPFAYVNGIDPVTSYNGYISYPGGGRWVLTDWTEDVRIGVICKGNGNNFNAILSGSNAFLLLDMLNKDERSTYSGDFEPTENSIMISLDSGSIVLYENNLLLDDVEKSVVKDPYMLSPDVYRNISSLLGMVSARRYVDSGWSYTATLGTSKQEKAFERMSLTLTLNSSRMNVYGDGDYRLFDSIQFSNNGIKLTIDSSRINMTDAYLDALTAIDDGSLPIRDVAMLFVDDAEYPLELKIITSDDKWELIFSTGNENQIDYNSLKNSIRFTLGDTVKHISQLEELSEYDISPEDNRYRYLDAMRNPGANIAQLELQLCGVEAGMYSSYESLVFGEQSYEIVRYNENYSQIWWRVEVLESKVDGIAPGEHCYRVDDGMTGTTISEAVRSDPRRDFAQIFSDNPELADSAATLAETSSGGAAEDYFLLYWFGTCGIYDIPEYGQWDEAAKKVDYNLYFTVFDYLGCRYGLLTAEEIDSMGKEWFGIENLFDKTGLANDDYNKVGDKWAVPGHGGELWAYDVVDIRYVDQSRQVTLLFWADFSRTVKSHVITYRTGEDMVGASGHDMGCDYVETGKYPPAHISV